MRSLLWLVSLCILGFAVASGTGSTENHTLIVTGSTAGYLAPCGCTKPMSGGLKRRITAIRSWTTQGKTTVVDNGGFVGGIGRQDHMKAETIAETMKLVKIAAVNCGLEEVRLGRGMLAAIDRLSGSALVQTASPSITDLAASGPFLIGGVDPRRAEMSSVLGEALITIDEAVRSLTDEAEASGLVPVLMTRGDIEHAEDLARKHKAVRLIVCATKSSPLERPKMVGGTLIVTPGEHGKFVLKIEWDGERFVAYDYANLGPEFVDDPDATRMYQAYLARVTREDLLAMVPREDTAKFAGSETCAPCHAQESEIWRSSRHASALSTLEKTGNDRDPDCVGCHVVGLSSVSGFMNRKQTPLMSDVGCESCHGPSREHALNPMKIKPQQNAVQSCAKCHNPQHSPGFGFEEYWSKIAHGPVDNHGKNNELSKRKEQRVPYDGF